MSREDLIARDTIWSLTNEARSAGVDDLTLRDELQELIARGFEYVFMFVSHV